MFEATPQRKKLVVIILLLLAGVGGAIRLLAPNPSTLRDLGSLLLVLWVPVIGNVVGFFARKIKLRRANGFGDRPFSGELRVEIAPLANAPASNAPPDGTLYAFVVGTEGFSARLSHPLAWPERAQPLVVDAQFLRPTLALPRFAGGTAFRVLAHNQLVAQGRVLQVTAPSA